MLTIGIYPRKSVYRDNFDSVQVQIQLQLCKDYAGIIYKDQEVEFHVYDKDEGGSGKNTNTNKDIRLNLYFLIPFLQFGSINLMTYQHFTGNLKIFCADIDN